MVEEALDAYLTDNEDSREDVFVSSLLGKVGVKLTHAKDENGLLLYMHINPPTFVKDYSYKEYTYISGTNKVSESTVSIHVNYNRQGKGRNLYSEFDIVETIYRYHDIMQGKCDHYVPRRPSLPDLSKGGLILFFHLPKTGGSSLRHLAKSNEQLEYYSNEHHSMDASKALITHWTKTTKNENLGRTKFFEFHWQLEPCKYFNWKQNKILLALYFLTFIFAQSLPLFQVFQLQEQLRAWRLDAKKTEFLFLFLLC